MNAFRKVGTLDEVEQILFGEVVKHLTNLRDFALVVENILFDLGWLGTSFRFDPGSEDKPEITISAKTANPERGDIEKINGRLASFRYNGRILRIKTYCISSVDPSQLGFSAKQKPYETITFRIITQSPQEPLKAPLRSPGWSSGSSGLRSRLR